MILTAFTFFHVVLSLIGIGAGLVVLFGLLTSRSFHHWTTLFLTTTVATSVTGFLFPFHHFMPSHVVGIISLIVLAIAIRARHILQTSGHWRKTFVVMSSVALYLNVFVLIAQLFQKVPALKALAPTQSEPPFQVTQLVILLLFATLTILATVRFHAAPLRTA